MSDESRTNIGTPVPDASNPEELREQVEHTRDELGRTVEELAAKADVKAQAKKKTAQAATRVRETATRAGQYAADRAPDPLLDIAGRAASVARANRRPLVAGGALLAAFLLVRRGRGRR